MAPVIEAERERRKKQEFMEKCRNDPGWLKYYPDGGIFVQHIEELRTQEYSTIFTGIAMLSYCFLILEPALMALNVVYTACHLIRDFTLTLKKDLKHGFGYLHPDTPTVKLATAAALLLIK